MKTFSVNCKEVKRGWLDVDVKDKVWDSVAAGLAEGLIGKE